jgi:photosystem II stability/assembly factor-like uncharacterized protein
MISRTLVQDPENHMHITPSLGARTATLLALIAAPALHAQSGGTVAQQFEKLHFRSIGPAIMSGRIADVTVYEKNTAIWYAGTAHGGVWKTTSNGAIMTPIFEDHGLMSIGDVTVSQQNPDVLWVGTGESNNRQSTSWGSGVWKTTDGGKTFQQMGLKDSKHINRILIDPTNDDVVLVAATGPLFGSGGERGVFKTTTAARPGSACCSSTTKRAPTILRWRPSDPKTIYASTYQRRRTACCMNGGGTGSGIWKSIDGGDTWTRLSNGIPAGPLGRIAVDVYRKNPSILYASIEAPGAGRGGAAAAEGADTAAAGGGGRGGGRGGGGGAGGGESGLYRSDDAGQTWRRVSTTNPRPMYFSQVRIDPNNADRVLMGGVKMQMTVDAGKTMEGQASLTAHDDVHAIWIDPNNSDHVIIGDDGGLYTSYDGVKTWNFYGNVPVGLFYHVNYDMSTPYNVCGGMQDNYDWCGPSQVRPTTRHLQPRLGNRAGWRRLCLHPGSSRRAHHLQRVARRQHDAQEQSHRRVEEHSADGAERDAGSEAGRIVPVPLGHADDRLVDRSGFAHRRGKQSVRLARSR